MYVHVLSDLLIHFFSRIMILCVVHDMIAIVGESGSTQLLPSGCRNDSPQSKVIQIALHETDESRARIPSILLSFSRYRHHRYCYW